MTGPEVEPVETPSAPERIVLVPGVLALLPDYASLTDPVPALRAACLAAVGWLVEGGRPVTVLADAQGARVGADLLRRVGGSVTPPAPGEPEGPVLVVGNGSARRSDVAPGQLDERAHAFDERLATALRAGDGVALAATDRALADELLAAVHGVVELAGRVPVWGPAEVDLDDDPFGVQYWVMRWAPA